jgi:hypothetical protein
MKRIVRLTESDLTRLVRRIIKEQNEQANPVADKILSEMEYLCNNGKAESNAMVGAVMKIKDKATYDAVANKVRTSPNFKQRQGKNYGSIADWLVAEGISQVATPSGDGTKLMSGISNLSRGTGVAESISNHLGKFNPDETSDLSYGTETF